MVQVNDYEERMKRKRLLQRPQSNFFSIRSLSMYMSFFVFLLFISSDRSPFRSGTFHPVLLRVPTLSLLPTSLIRESLNTRSLPLIVEDRVLLHDHLLLILCHRIHPTEKLDCVYYREGFNSSESDVLGQVLFKPAISIDDYHEHKSVVRCHIPPTNYSSAVGLRQAGDVLGDDDWLRRVNQTAMIVPSWDRVVYDAMLDERSVVVFVKGLNLRPHVESDPSRIRCHFGLSSFQKDERFVFTTQATTAAQEVIRCLLPRSIQSNPEKALGLRVTVSRSDGVRGALDAPLPSVAKVQTAKSYKQGSNKAKHELCACTMLWNQASFLREWIMYHAWLGVERWFIYDNNSDDMIQEVIDELNMQNYNVSRHVWPWIKTQEAGFSHCALRAKDECKWLGFFDVDEFFYLPHKQKQEIPGPNSLRALVSNYSDSPTYAEIRTTCHSFGPSGLSSAPAKGVTAGYTCRLQAPERHKSFVRLELIHPSLLNLVHHFRLEEGYSYLNVRESSAVVNHYKYQVWDTFKAKFYRRVSTYVTNWQEDQNQGSKDRVPGLGTEAIEPRNWRLRFCEVHDTGLKDFVLANLADSATGMLPWERSPVTNSHMTGAYR